MFFRKIRIFWLIFFIVFALDNTVYSKNESDTEQSSQTSISTINIKLVKNEKQEVKSYISNAQGETEVLTLGTLLSFSREALEGSKLANYSATQFFPIYQLFPLALIDRDL